MPVTAAIRYHSEIHSPVLVFATSVQSREDVIALTPALNALAGQDLWNFALDDDDRILRIVSPVEPLDAIQLLGELGYNCQELED